VYFNRLLGAELGYLVLDHCSPESLRFASTHGVEILQAAGLSALESALHIGNQFWPGRANFMVYEPMERALVREAEGKGSAMQFWLQGASEIWREASALSLSYGKLNVLLGQLVQLGDILKKEAPTGQNAILYSFAVAALLVRLSQYVLFSAADTLGMTKTEREGFVTERLTSGGLGLEQTRRVMSSALNLAKVKLQEHGVEPPPNWDAEHLVTPPGYSRAFVEVVDRVVADGHRARLLPLAMELRLFGFVGDERGSSGLMKRVGYALPLTGLIRGFAIQSLGLPDALVRGPATLHKQIETVADKSNGSVLEGEEAPLLPGIKGVSQG
jgi:hypothetical protein